MCIKRQGISRFPFTTYNTNKQTTNTSSFYNPIFYQHIKKATPTSSQNIIRINTIPNPQSQSQNEHLHRSSTLPLPKTHPYPKPHRTTSPRSSGKRPARLPHNPAAPPHGARLLQQPGAALLQASSPVARAGRPVRQDRRPRPRRVLHGGERSFWYCVA